MRGRDMTASRSVVVLADDAPTLPTLPGWVLEKALAAERASGFPFLASLLEATTSRQKLIIALIALFSWPEIGWRLEAEGQSADPQLLFKAPERLIARRVIGPARGFLGSLRRMNGEALEAPRDYVLLLALLSGKDRRKRKAVLYLSGVSTSVIRTLAALEASLVRPGVECFIWNEPFARAANEALAFLKSRSTADLEAPEWAWLLDRLVGETWIPDWVEQALSACGDRFPRGPLPETSGFWPIDTGPELVRIGREWKNCLGSKVLDAANGARAYYLVSLEGEPGLAEDERRVIVELSRYLHGQTEIWLLDSINRPGNASVSQALLHAVEGRLSLHDIHRLRAVQPDRAWPFESDEDREEMLLASLMRRDAG